MINLFVELEQSGITQNSFVSRIRRYFGINQTVMQESIDEGKLVINSSMVHAPILNEFLGEKYFYCCRDERAVDKVKNVSLFFLLSSKTFKRTYLYDAYIAGITQLPVNLQNNFVLVFNMFKQLMVLTKMNNLDDLSGCEGAIVMPEGFVMEPINNYLQRMCPKDIEDEVG